MAFKLRLTQGGTELFDFTDMTNCYASGDRGGWISRAWSSGDAEASDIFRVRFVGGLTAVRTSMGKINRAFEAANRYHDSRSGAPVYIEVKIEDADGWWQSELAKDCQLNSYDVDQALRTGTMDALLTIYRRNYWQGAKTQLAITNPNGTANTTGLRVYNCNDGATVDTTYKRNNYFTVAGTAIAGDLPAPIELTLSVNGTLNPDDMAITNLYLSAVDKTLTDVVQEAAGGDATVADTDYSGGSFQRLNLTTAYKEYNLVDNDFDTDERDYHLLVRFAEFPAGVVTGYFSEQYTRFTSPPRILTTDPLQLVALWSKKASTHPGQMIGHFKAASAGNLGIDTIAFLPAERFAQLQFAPLYVVTDATATLGIYDNSVIDEPHTKIFYVDPPTFPAGTYLYRNCPTCGPGLTLTPGEDHTLSLLWDGESGPAAPMIDMFVTAKLSYYPRRRTL